MNFEERIKLAVETRKCTKSILIHHKVQWLNRLMHILDHAVLNIIVQDILNRGIKDVVLNGVEFELSLDEGCGILKFIQYGQIVKTIYLSECDIYLEDTSKEGFTANRFMFFIYTHYEFVIPIELTAELDKELKIYFKIAIEMPKKSKRR